ncbi:MAG: hypothetical protein KBT11_09790 [Treponema sp.]|nr:hypothetical protein [Candidatus Treponema equifaecale]
MRARNLLFCLICFCVFAGGCKRIEKNSTDFSEDKNFDGIELENGLKIYHRYLTDSELEKLEVPEISFKHFEDFKHQCVIDGNLMEIPLRTDYGYKSRGMIVENDKIGRQWVHFFINSVEKYIPKDFYKAMNARSKFTPRDKTVVRGKCFEEFNFIADSTDNQKLRIGIANFGLRFPKMSVSMIDVYLEKGGIYVKFHDVAEDVLIDELTSSNAFQTEKFFLGEYVPGTEEKLRLECSDRKMTVSYGENSKSYVYSERVPEGILGYFNAGITPYNKEPVFAEMLVSDLELEFGK